MFDIFLLLRLLSLKEGPFEIRKNVFYFVSKALFILDILKFQNFIILNLKMSSGA